MQYLESQNWYTLFLDEFDSAAGSNPLIWNLKKTLQILGRFVCIDVI